MNLVVRKQTNKFVQFFYEMEKERQEKKLHQCSENFEQSYRVFLRISISSFFLPVYQFLFSISSYYVFVVMI
jgi:hypothetical protein